MNPAPRMRLIEIVRGMQTSQESYEKAKGIAEALGKVTCTSNDRPGFIVPCTLYGSALPRAISALR